MIYEAFSINLKCTFWSFYFIFILHLKKKWTKFENFFFWVSNKDVYLKKLPHTENHKAEVKRNVVVRS